jgi:RimJ/RimL family protein N-acetyltransferase
MNPTTFTIRLDESHRRALRNHFLALAGEDRRLRFGFIASDAVIERYVDDINFSRDAVFGVNVDSRSFEGVAHLALDKPHAELGLSVLHHYRKRGIGTALVSRAMVHARNRQINVLFMQCLSENGAMRRIAESLGMCVVTQGPESEARMNLPCADTLSILSEWVENQVALCDAALRKAPLPCTAAAIPR